MISAPSTPSKIQLPREASKPRGMPAAEMGHGIRGDWKYETAGKLARLPLAAAIAVSLGLHTIFLFGFNTQPVKVRVVQKEDVELIQMSMPPLEEEKNEKVEELTEAADEPPTVAVPQLADLPTSVTVSTFVQPLQYTQDVTANLANAKVSQIPVNIGRGGKGLANMGTIFEISQLDRAPTPIMQPAPVFPYALKQSVDEARVVVEFIVDSNGDVVGPFVVNTTHPGFNEAAVSGVAKWKFKPGMKAGKRVNTRVRAPVNFFVTSDT
jgi:protein TonB